MQNTQTAQECLIAEVVEDLDKIVTVITAVADRVKSSDTTAYGLLSMARRDLMQNVNELEQITGS